MAKNPNPARRWATHSEWCYEQQGLPEEVLRRILKRDLRTIRNWTQGLRPIPHWAPRMLRLHRIDAAVALAQMTGQDVVSLEGMVFVRPPRAAAAQARKAA